MARKFVTSMGLFVQKLLIRMIRCYQLFISPYFRGSCRFIPTCSEYCLLAIERFGVFKGIFLGLKRIAKCHPGYSGEWYDAVPEITVEKHNER